MRRIGELLGQLEQMVLKLGWGIIGAVLGAFHRLVGLAFALAAIGLVVVGAVIVARHAREQWDAYRPPPRAPPVSEAPPSPPPPPPAKASPQQKPRDPIDPFRHLITNKKGK